MRVSVCVRERGGGRKKMVIDMVGRVIKRERGKCSP